MKIQKIILPLVLGAMLAACSPRVDDIFDDTAMVRLEKRRTDLKNQFINAPNGWVMQYFAQSDATSSDSIKHRGYTFLMQFRADGTVTVGAPVNGVYDTETSMWDILNDNSSVLTFNTFNRIFHYYSNPDPDLGLWGADGEGVGGDYEFMILEYNSSENYQLLKGKKNSCYVRMYPLAAGEDWEGYFAKIDAIDQFIFEEQTPLDLYSNNSHFTLYNGYSHEVRAFKFGADTLGGGSYYGLIVTDKGIRFHDDTILSAQIHRAEFRLNNEKTRLVSVENPNTYITVDGKTAFISDAANAKPWIIDTDNLPASVVSARNTLSASIAALVSNSYVTNMVWYGAGKDRLGLRIYYVVGGDAGKSYDIYYFNVNESGQTVTLTADDTYSPGSILYQYGALDLVHTFDGTYSVALQHGFHPSKGITATKTNDASFTLHMTH